MKKFALLLLAAFGLQYCQAAPEANSSPALASLPAASAPDPSLNPGDPAPSSPSGGGSAVAQESVPITPKNPSSAPDSVHGFPSAEADPEQLEFDPFTVERVPPEVLLEAQAALTDMANEWLKREGLIIGWNKARKTHVALGASWVPAPPGAGNFALELSPAGSRAEIQALVSLMGAKVAMSVSGSAQLKQSMRSLDWARVEPELAKLGPGAERVAREALDALGVQDQRNAIPALRETLVRIGSSRAAGSLVGCVGLQSFLVSIAGSSFCGTLAAWSPLTEALARGGKPSILAPPLSSLTQEPDVVSLLDETGVRLTTDDETGELRVVAFGFAAAPQTGLPSDALALELAFVEAEQDALEKLSSFKGLNLDVSTVLARASAAEQLQSPGGSAFSSDSGSVSERTIRMNSEATIHTVKLREFTAAHPLAPGVPIAAVLVGLADPIEFEVDSGPIEKAKPIVFDGEYRSRPRSRSWRPK